MKKVICSRCGEEIPAGDEYAEDKETDEYDEEKRMCEDCCQIYLDRFYSTFELMEKLGFAILTVEEKNKGDEPLDGQLDMFGGEYHGTDKR